MKKPIEEEIEVYTEDDYDNMLDECYPDTQIAGMTYSTSYALKELDPIAYRCGFSDYQEYKTVYKCPICGEEHEEEEEALLCCQSYYECDICGEEFEEEQDSINCCKEEEI